MKQDANQPSPRREFDLDHVNLHGDVTVDRFRKEDLQRQKPSEPKKRSNRELWFSAFLNMVLAAGIAFLLWQRQETQLQTHTEKSSLETQLNETTASLESAKQKIQELEGNNQKLKNTGTNLSEQQKVLNSSVEQERANTERYKNEAKQLKSQLSKLEGKNKTLKSDYDKFKKQADKKEKDYQSQISSLEGNLVETKTDFQNQVNGLKGKLEDSLIQQDRLNLDLGRYKEQIKEEAKAGRAAMQEQGRLSNENKIMIERLRKLEDERKGYLAQIKDLKEVTTGELIPFSTDITLPVPNFKEPVPKTAKWPRGTDFIVVHMLINESGSVSEIYYPQGQLIDADFQYVASPVFFKWKFSPPRYKNLNVKAWVPVIVHKP